MLLWGKNLPVEEVASLADVNSIRIFIKKIGIFTKKQVLSDIQAILEPIAQVKDEHEIYWDKIKAIEAVGLKPVYDLTIPETHNFVANDVCVHNTSFAMNLAEHAAINNKMPVAVFSMEMSNEQLAMRLISSLGKVNLQNVRTGNLQDNDWTQMIEAVSKLTQSYLFIDETPALNPTELRSRARRLAREKGQLGLIVIDYLQLMQVPNNKENRTNEVSEISRALKSLAKELNVPVVALSQLNRSLEQRSNKRPIMSDLRESGEIEQSADLVIFIYRDEVYNENSLEKGKAEIIVAKQRNGPIGTIFLTFQGKFTRFEPNTEENYHGE
ncbi:replicative DNA helicase [Candidatus Thiomargarita nelsonii]|uniref:DNA 5'-3' helicase DnaB n=1 Tax=Candidatus Thiomargarita nelsonii TaxID=1003181 RepID=A0A176RTR3_9GAMM|nr:replicative DNA helicase [Candidatus Thiomargarita nelsonii]